jgi:hypothetical protein
VLYVVYNSTQDEQPAVDRLKSINGQLVLPSTSKEKCIDAYNTMPHDSPGVNFAAALAAHRLESSFHVKPNPSASIAGQTVR